MLPRRIQFKCLQNQDQGRILWDDAYQHWSQLQVAIWSSGTPEHFLIHVQRAVHFFKQMGLATKFKEQDDSVMALKIDWEILKGK